MPALGSVLAGSLHSVNHPAMRIYRTPQAMQRAARQWQREDSRIGFVPTMGYLHAGHLSLVEAARKRVGPKGRVVVSIYVNPTQFAPHEDLSTYPRDLPRDLQLCRDAQVDAVFFPTDAVMYPGRESGDYSTYVAEELVSQGLEGVSRPTHFRGVTTIVAKLFNCVLPDVAVFGAKDWQQAAVIRRMSINLNFPVKVIVAPTHRESDGLAMSSRNVYLSPTERPEATVLWRSILWCRRRVKEAGEVPAAILSAEVQRLVETESRGRLDYAAFFDGVSLRPVERVTSGTHMALAVFLGKVRLIDNGRL